MKHTSFKPSVDLDISKSKVYQIHICSNKIMRLKGIKLTLNLTRCLSIWMLQTLLLFRATGSCTFGRDIIPAQNTIDSCMLNSSTFADGISKSCFSLRGGIVLTDTETPVNEEVDSECDISEAEAIISRFLSDDESNRDFHVQGWRWHTLSLVRDTSRLEKLAMRVLSQATESGFAINSMPLEKASRHVIDFNMGGLNRIENNLLFPWLRNKLCSHGEDRLKNAFSQILNKIDKDRSRASKLALAVKDQAKLASSPKRERSQCIQATKNLALLSGALTSLVDSIMDQENKFLVPAVAKIVPKKEQKSFNNKVLLELGILESRVHLVGMYDAVVESGIEKEREMFRDFIPVIPRMMIPNWRKKLYNPQAGILDGDGS